MFKFFLPLFVGLFAVQARATDFTVEEELAVARVIFAECVGEPPEGQAAVVYVIRERLRLPGFPKGGVQKVLLQTNAFSCVTHGGSRLYRQAKGFDAKTKDPRWQAVLATTRAALRRPIPPEFRGAVFYKEKSITRFPGMRLQPTKIARVGAHDFYK